MKNVAVLSALLAVATAAPGYNSCPKNGLLPPGAISPSKIVPISKKNPDKVYGCTTDAQITKGDMCTIFNLDLPDTFNGQPTQNMTCDLIFDFPTAKQSPKSHLSFSGPGHFSFTGYAIGAGATEESTWNNQPAPGPSPPNPPKVMTPGNSYVINSAPCGIPPGAGKVTAAGVLCSDDTSLLFRQNTNVCPMGFYVIIH